MVKDLVGYRFSPTGEELINYYLKNKILGKTWLVDEAISEINICSYDPIYLPSLSKIQSDDLVWYFFSPKEYTSVKKNVTKRTTSSGYWKATGVDRKIKDKRGNNRGEIGIKKTLVYYEGRVPKGVRTPWVMHEYHITCFPQDQRNYVICQVMYKGEDGDISSGGNYSSEPSQSLVSDLNTVRATINTAHKFEQPGPENVIPMNDGLSVDDLIMIPMNEQEDCCPWDVLDPNTLFGHHNHPNLQGNRNNYRPKKALSGIIPEYSCDTDSDAESISAMSYQGSSSPGDSVGSSNRHSQPGLDEIISLSKDLQTSDEPSISRKTRESQLARRTIPSKQEVKHNTSRAADASIDKESSMVKTEKKGWFITEKAMERNHKNPKYIYLMRMIIGFILLLALIDNIISVLLTVKT